MAEPMNRYATQPTQVQSLGLECCFQPVWALLAGAAKASHQALTGL